MSTFKIRSLCAAFAVAGGLVAATAFSPAVAADAAGSRVIVKFKAGALAQGKAELAARGGRIMVDLSEVNAVAARLSPQAVALLKRSRFVDFVEVDHPQYPMAMAGETVPYGIPMVQANQVSDSAAGNQKLCIIDSGIDGLHPDFAGVPMTGENLTTSGTWDTDESAHGTHVAGTIAAVGGNGIGVVGVLPNAVLPLHIAKVFDASGSTSSSTVAKAMLACRKAGANVISMSLGGSLPSRLQEIVVGFLDKRGILMIAAAGNAGTTAVSYPAGFPQVMSVAAVDEAKAKADFSQFNPTVEIAAPGVLTLSTVPLGSALVATTTVGGTGYESLGMVGSPVGSAAAPLYDFGLGQADDAGVAGKVCLIQRGVISFAEKVQRCQTNGGVAAILYNNEPGLLAGTLGGVATAIPSVGVSDVAGAAMLGQLGQMASVAIAGGDYDFFSGTSMATPHVAAVAALVWSQHPGCTAAQIRASLNNSAEDLGAPGRDNEFGHGLVQAKAATDRIAALGCGN